MSHIFISHVEEDGPVALEIAQGLEAAGYQTWYYEGAPADGTARPGGEGESRVVRGGSGIVARAGGIW